MSLPVLRSRHENLHGLFVMFPCYQHHPGPHTGSARPPLGPPAPTASQCMSTSSTVPVLKPPRPDLCTASARSPSGPAPSTPRRGMYTCHPISWAAALQIASRPPVAGTVVPSGTRMLQRHRRPMSCCLQCSPDGEVFHEPAFPLPLHRPAVDFDDSTAETPPTARHGRAAQCGFFVESTPAFPLQPQVPPLGAAHNAPTPQTKQSGCAEGEDVM